MKFTPVHDGLKRPWSREKGVGGPNTVWVSEEGGYRIDVEPDFIALGRTPSEGAAPTHLIIKIDRPSLAGFIVNGLLKAMAPIYFNETFPYDTHEEVMAAMKAYMAELVGTDKVDYTEVASLLYMSVDVHQVRDYMARQKAAAAKDGEQ